MTASCLSTILGAGPQGKKPGMTEFEYAELIAIYSSNAGAFFAIYLTVISGFLITAFVAGTRLSAVQTFILSFGFAVAAFVTTWGSVGAGLTQVYYTQELLALNSGPPQSNRAWVMYTVGALMCGGALAALFFMWNVRSRHRTVRRTAASAADDPEASPTS